MTGNYNLAYFCEIFKKNYKTEEFCWQNLINDLFWHFYTMFFQLTWNLKWFDLFTFSFGKLTFWHCNSTVLNCELELSVFIYFEQEILEKYGVNLLFHVFSLISTCIFHHWESCMLKMSRSSSVEDIPEQCKVSLIWYFFNVYLFIVRRSWWPLLTFAV